MLIITTKSKIKIAKFKSAKKINITSMMIILLVLFGMSNKTYAQRGMFLPDSISSNFFKECEARLRYWDTIPLDKKKGEYKQFKRWQYFWEPRVFLDGSYPSQQLLVDAWTRANDEIREMRLNQSKNNQFQSMPIWQELGPNRDPEGANTPRRYFGVGRLNVVRVHPNNTNEIWVGSAAGGVWVSKNAGQSWNVLYQTEFLSLGVSDIAIAPSNPSTIYVATGDNNGAIAGSPSVYSIGIIKSTDGGLTWNITGHSAELIANRLVSSIWVHPDDENLVVAASNDGIIRSTDGGNTWVLTSQNYHFADIEQMPDNPNVLYACTMVRSRITNSSNFIFKSTDAGRTWTLCRTINGARRTCIEVTPAAKNSLYALSCNPAGGFLSVIISDDAGETWNDVNVYSATSRNNYLGWANTTTLYDTTTNGQGFYDLAMAVHPTDANRIFIGGVNIWMSTNKGRSFSLRAHWSGSHGAPYVHADIHDLRYSGLNLYVAHDGGLDITSNSGSTWTGLNYGLGISQIYRFSNSRQNANRMAAGFQDLGSRFAIGGVWSYLGGGDGMYCEFDPQTDDRLYYSIYYGSIWRYMISTNSGRQNPIISPTIVGYRFGVADSGNWTTPFVVSPINPQKIYVGYANIYHSRDMGDNWTKQTNFSYSSTNTFRHMRISEKDDNYIYAATLTNLRVTKNGGETWTAMNHPGGTSNSISGIAIHPDNPEVIFLTYSGFRANNKLFMYDGNQWLNLSGNLPNIPVNCVELHKVNDILNIYVGTDIGVYHMVNDIPYFKRWGQDLPNLYISQLEYVSVNNKMRAASYGRGIWEIDVNNTENQEYINIATTGDFEICNGDSVRLYIENPAQTDIYWSTGETTNEIWVKERGQYWAVSNSKSVSPSISNIVDVSVKDTSLLSISNTSTLDFCIGDSVRLVASQGGGIDPNSYLWSTGETTRGITVKDAGVYTVQVTTQQTGCISRAAITVNTYEPPEPATILILYGSPNQTTGDIYDTLRASIGNKFQWYKNGTRINGATQRNYVVLRDSSNVADYTVSIALGGDCYSELSEPHSYVSVEDDNVVQAKMLIHPNPAANEFIIEMNASAAGVYDISILDMLGTVVKSITNVQIDNTFKVDISALPIGNYIIKVSSKRNNFIDKLNKI